MRARDVERSAVRLQRRLVLAHAVTWWLGGVMVASVAWAGCVLILRICNLAAPGWVWLGVNGSVLLTGLFVAWRRRPARAACLAAVECASASGGIVLAYADGAEGSESWLAQLGAVHAPRVRWRIKRQLARLLAAVLCVPVAYLVPLPGRTAATTAQAELGGLITALEAEALALEQACGTETGLAHTVRLQLAELARAGAGDAQRHTWEALDHVREQLDAAARASAQAALRAADEWHALDTALQRLEAAARAGASANKGALQQAREQLRTAAAQSTWSNELTGASTALAGGAQVPPEQRAALRGLLNSLSNHLLRSAGQLSTNLLLRGGLTNLAALAQHRISGGGADGAAQALERFLAKEPRGFEQLGSNATARACALAAARGQQWSTSRGRGDAPLTFHAPSDEHSAAVRRTALPEAPRRSLDEVVLLGESAHAPQETRADESVSGGALAAAQAGAGHAQDEPLLPRHRACVEEYFKE